MNFSKTPKQAECVRMLTQSALHNMAYGGSRSGKTFILIFAIIVRASKCRSRHGVFRRTFNSLKTSIWLDTLPKVLKICFPHLPVTLNKTDYYITLPNESEVWFCGLDDDKRIDKVLGKEFSTLYFNECSEINYSAIQVVLSRLAEKTPLKKKVYYDMNPPSKSHWSYWLFIRGIDPQEDEPIEDPENYKNIVMNPMDNLANIDENYIKILEKMPQVQRERFLLGKFSNNDDGQVYYSFDRDKHVSDKVKKGMGQIYIGMDFNVQPMTCTVAQVVNGCLYVFDERFLENSDTFKMCDSLVKGGYAGATVICDSTGKNRKTSGKSDFDILKSNGFTIPSVRNPLVIDRVNNVNYLLTQDRIKIHPRCKKLINDLERVSWLNGKLNQQGDSKLLTHISDSLGYMAFKLLNMQIPSKPINISKYR